MSTISVSLPADGETINASDYNTPITTIVNEINGNLDNNNIKSAAAISGSKIATGGIGTTQLADGAATAAKQTATKYSSSVSGSGTVTSASFANFPTNRCFVDVVTANANAIIFVFWTGEGAYAGATGSAYIRFNLTNANSGTSTYARRMQNSDASQRVPASYNEIVTLSSSGTTRVELQIAGSSTASCLAENVVLTVIVLQDKG